MKTDRKGGIVSRMQNKRTGRAGVMRLDKTSMTFFARVPDEGSTHENRGKIEYFESKDGREVERWLEAVLKKTITETAVRWLPVVEVTHSIDDDDYRSRRRHREQMRSIGVRASINRYWIALTSDGKKWLTLSWEQADEASTGCLAPEDRLAAASDWRDGPKAEHDGMYRDADRAFSLPWFEGDEAIVEHTDELWAGLVEVLTTLERSGKTLSEMVGTKKGLKMIAEVGAGMKRLTSGSITAEKA